MSKALNNKVKLNDIVSVKDFGAVGDGVADDYAAFVAALTASNNVFVPSGTYKLSANLPPLVSKVLRGENSVTTFLKPTAAVTTAITLNSDSIISDFTIDGSNTTNATGVLVGSVLTSPAQARDIAVIDFAGATGYGIYVSWAVGVNFYNVRSSTNGKGLFITNPNGAGSFPTYIVFNDCQFTFNTSHGAYIINGYGITFNNCQFEYNTNEGLYAPSNGVVERLTLNNCWFERNFDSSGAAYQARFDGSAGGAVLSYTSLTNCYFANHTAKAAIFIKALATSFRSNQIPANAGTVLFNTNSYGWIVEQDNTAYITDSTGFMQQFQPYVEGSFVPTIIGATTAGVGTYTTQVGWYTKIGNLVTVTVSLTWTAHTGTGPIRVANLPFAAKAAGGNPTATVITDGISLTAGNYASAYVADGLSQILLTQCPTGGGALATVPMDTAGSVQLTATYRI